MLGDAFSTADIIYGSTLALFKGSPLLPPDALREAYVELICTGGEWGGQAAWISGLAAWRQNDCTASAAASAPQ